MRTSKGQASLHTSVHTLSVCASVDVGTRATEPKAAPREQFTALKSTTCAMIAAKTTRRHCQATPEAQLASPRSQRLNAFDLSPALLSGTTHMMNMSAAAPVSAPAAASATAPSKTAMMFMRASSKAQQDKGKDLSVSIENLKAELSGLQWHAIARFNAACCGWASSCGQ